MAMGGPREALALFEHSTSREMLGAAAGLGDDPIGRDDGLAELLVPAPVAAVPAARLLAAVVAEVGG